MMQNTIKILAACLLVSALFGSTLHGQQTVGLFLNDPSTTDGYVLVAPNANTNTYLIDNCGRVVHEWPSGYAPGNVVKFLENGSLFRTCRIANTTFNAGGLGGRIQLQDWAGNVTWYYEYTSNLYSQHHDAEYLPNGNVLFIAWEAKTRAEAIAQGRDTTLLGQRIWPDHLIEIQPTTPGAGNVVWEWHAWDHLVQDYDSTKANFGVVADHPELINFNWVRPGSTNYRDWLHTNAVSYNPTLDQIAISIHNFDEIWVIDHSTTTSEAASHSGGQYGKGGDLLYRFGNPATYGRSNGNDHLFFGMHDVQWVPAGDQFEGQMMVFNNGLARPAGDFSTVEIWQQPVDSAGNYALQPGMAYGPAAVTWTYQDNPPTNFFSQIISSAQRLPLNHTLIAEGTTGRIFEIDDQSNKIWEYVNPVVSTGPLNQGDPATGNAVFRAYRYLPSFPGLSGQVLTPGLQLEGNPLPLPANCTPSAVADPSTADFSVGPNPFTQNLNIQLPTDEAVWIDVFDLQGRRVLSQLVDGPEGSIAAGQLGSGLYLLKRRDGGNALKVLKR